MFFFEKNTQKIAPTEERDQGSVEPKNPKVFCFFFSKKKSFLPPPTSPLPKMTALETILRDLGRAAVAVSGGIDSLTLATLTHRVLGDAARMHHAVSPAVPAEATARVRDEANRQGWSLDIFDAGEFADANYRANPVNRCFFCKTNLYGAIAARTADPILSGTNTDDLGEYRPGLEAARDHAVRHPFVEAGIDKAGVRRLASRLGLGTLADLPSSPCLSSRIETGLRIEAPLLGLVHAAETLVAETLHPHTVRCRVRAAGVVVELDPETLHGLAENDAADLRSRIAALGVTRPISFAPYRNGSAFLQPASSQSPP